MTDFFMKILEMSIMGSVVILVTILMRLFLKKSSKKYVMILWAIVALRLLVPVSFESALSVFNYIPHKVTSISVAKEEVSAPEPALKAVPEVKKTDVKPVTEVKAPVSEVSNEVVKTELQTATKTEVSKVNKAESVIAKEAEAAVPKTSKGIDWKTVLGIVYGVGVVGILGYCVISYVMLKRRIKDATEIEKNVYESEKVNSPFVLGFLIPKIYLPDVLETDEREYILLHERTHIRHGDWISKLIGMAVVAVHWFNPIVWIGYALYEQDVEMFCDEDTVAAMDNELKKAYTMSIVTHAKKNSGKVYLVAPLSFSKPNFGKREVTNRVKNIINYRKGTKITAILTTIVVFGVSTACAFNSTSESKKELSKTTETTSVAATEATDVTVADDAHDIDSADSGAELEADDCNPDEDFAELGELLSYSDNAESKVFYYERLMDKAAELHEEDEDDSLLYGCVYGYFNTPVDWKLIVFDKVTGEYTAYSWYVYSGIVDVVEDFEPSYQDISTCNPEEWLMPYDDFASMPGFVRQDLMGAAYLTVYNKETYHTLFPDGDYTGSVYGWSEDMTKANVNLTPVDVFDLTVEEIQELKAGDTITVNGEPKVVENDFSDYNRVYYDDLCGVSIERLYYYPDDYLLRSNSGKDSSDYNFAEVPMADDVKINVYNLYTGKILKLSKDQVPGYFEKLSQVEYSDLCCFPGRGTSFFNNGSVSYNNHPLVIRNGVIEEMTIEVDVNLRDYEDLFAEYDAYM